MILYYTLVLENFLAFGFSGESRKGAEGVRQIENHVCLSLRQKDRVN